MCQIHYDDDGSWWSWIHLNLDPTRAWSILSLGDELPSSGAEPESVSGELSVNVSDCRLSMGDVLWFDDCRSASLSSGVESAVDSVPEVIPSS